MRKVLIVGLVAYLTIVFGSESLKAYGQNLSQFQSLYIYNFTKYIQWPDASKPLTIGAFGSGTINKELNKMVQVKGDGKLKFVELSSYDNLNDCDIIFLAKDQEGNLHKIIEKTSGKSILIVSEDEDSVEKGAGISFFLEGGRLRFSINKGVVEERNLKISSNLLVLAKVI